MRERDLKGSWEEAGRIHTLGKPTRGGKELDGRRHRGQEDSGGGEWERAIYEDLPVGRWHDKMISYSRFTIKSFQMKNTTQ